MRIIGANMQHNRARRRSWRAFGRNAEGAAAIEFAFIFPVMMVVYCGVVDVAQMVMLNRKVTQLTSTLSDLTARSKQAVSVADVATIFDAAKTVLMPYDTANVKMAVASVVIDSKGVARVCWVQQPAGGGATPDPGPAFTVPKAGDVVSVPDSVRVPNTSVIMARAAYRFVPIAGYVIQTDVTLGDHPVYTRPRAGQVGGTANIEQIIRTDTPACPRA